MVSPRRRCHWPGTRQTLWTGAVRAAGPVASSWFCYVEMQAFSSPPRAIQRQGKGDGEGVIISEEKRGRDGLLEGSQARVRPWMEKEVGLSEEEQGVTPGAMSG